MKRIISIICAVSIAAVFACCGSCDKNADTSQESYAENPNGIPDELNEFKLYLDGDEISLPLSFDELESKGWEYQGSKDIIIPTKKYLISDAFKKGESTIDAKIFNNSDVDIKISDGEIASLKFDYENMSKEAIKLPEDIILGKSTINQVKSAYGEPTYTADSDGDIIIDYQKDDNIVYRFTFSNETKVLTDIEMTNMPEFLSK